jgi:sugar/nucleoside kinase (ribokinase family)
MKSGMPSTNKPGVLCLGNIVYDTVIKPVDDLRWEGGTTFLDSIEYHVGGNGANTSRALAILGIPVRLVGAVGSDDQGCHIVEKLQHTGVDTHYVARIEGPTAGTVAMVNSKGDRKFFHCLGASKNAFADPVEFDSELCEGIGHYHLASFLVLPRLRARGPDTLIRAREAGFSTSFDTNWDPEGGWMRTLEPCLPHLDILFMNEDEGQMITGSADPATSAQIVLSKGLRTADMKLGSRGCAIYTQHEEIPCPAFDVEVKDTTGAGDCFAAGFICARLQGASLAEAGNFANAVAALSVQKLGAVAGVLSQTETEQWMKTACHRRAE